MTDTQEATTDSAEAESGTETLLNEDQSRRAEILRVCSEFVRGGPFRSLGDPRVLLALAYYVETGVDQDALLKIRMAAAKARGKARGKAEAEFLADMREHLGEIGILLAEVVPQEGVSGSVNGPEDEDQEEPRND